MKLREAYSSLCICHRLSSDRHFAGSRKVGMSASSPAARGRTATAVAAGASTKALLLECSLVSVPANVHARVVEVRSAMNPLDIDGLVARINDLDRQWRDDNIAALKRYESMTERAVAALTSSAS
jgi:hypothetical protein